KHRLMGAKVALLTLSMSSAWAASQTQYVRLPTHTVLKARLNQTVSSASSRAGDSFTATVTDPSLPEGTVVRGVVIGSSQASSDHPGRLGLDFRTLVLPNGRQVAISGSPIALDSKSVKQASNVRLVATAHSKKNTCKCVGIGAAGGLIIGSLFGKNVIGGLLGAGAGSAIGHNKDKKQTQRGVILREGTDLGVRLGRSVSVARAR